MADVAAAPEQSVSKGRRITFIVLTVVFGLGIGVGAFGFPSLIGGWFGFGDREVHKVHDLGYGAHAGILLAVPMLLQSVNPERKVAAMQGVAAAALAFVAGYTLGGPNAFVLVPIMVIALLWWLHPARADLMRTGRLQPALGVIVLLAAIPLAIYAFDQAEIQRACLEGDQHCDEFHYSGMAALGLGIPLVGLVASLRAPGWRIPAWSVGAAAAVLGLSGILFPDGISSIGTAWGTLALVGGVLFVGIGEWQARRREPAPAPTAGA